MIRIKNKVVPVWFQWDGDEASMKRALETIVTDIQMNGFNHYTTYVDVWDETAEEDKNWDGTAPKEPDATVTLQPNDNKSADASKPKTEAAKPKQSKPNSGLPTGDSPNVNKFTMEGSDKTATKSTKTAS